ncbi:LPS export ABC transporter periplasmic protein LptC [Thalassotalea atypica]|uniref:LPS export ABC transporter periplasmic protein LptC n=1 Tax=Thalassotalea atypica TaxID=2054316 RepID=UPI002573A4D3|nr:LPS export ABC transporter periplasmic protein LptC [Thalassotalea atypica]
MSRLYSWAFIVLLVSIAIYGTVQWRASLVEQEGTSNEELTPDFIAEALNSNFFNSEGLLSHEIQATKMEHFSGVSLTKFEQPFYTLYPKDQSAPWKVSAKEATLYNNNRVVLKNRVILKATEENSLIQEIHCKYLELDLNTNIISSDQTILIQGKNFTMYGSGLIIDLNTTQMTLTEHVQTIYKKITG